MRYEYKEVALTRNENRVTMLNTNGLQGWRFIKIIKGMTYLLERELPDKQQGKDYRAEEIIMLLSNKARSLVYYILANMGEGVPLTMESLSSITIDRLRKTRDLGAKYEKEIVEVFRNNEIFIS